MSAPVSPEVVEPIAAAVAPSTGSLEGQVFWLPRSSVGAFFLTICGYLPLSRATRALAQLVLGYDQRASLQITELGLRWTNKTKLLGRALREQDELIPLSRIVSIRREVRYPRVHLLAGIAGLTVGAYLGTAYLVDGVRAASPSLLVTGLLLMALGALVELGFISFQFGLKARCLVHLSLLGGQTRRLTSFAIDEVDSLLRELLPQVAASAPASLTPPPATPRA